MAVNNSVLPQQMRQEERQGNHNFFVAWLWRILFFASCIGLASVIILLPNQLSFLAPIGMVLLFVSSLALAKDLQNKRIQQR